MRTDFDAFDCCHCRYVEEHIQKAGVAIETQGFTFITSGRKRESLTVRTGTFPALTHKHQLTLEKRAMITTSYRFVLHAFIIYVQVLSVFVN